MKALVKICGLTRREDAELAVTLGASHVGMVRAESSPRRVSVEQAKAVFDTVAERAKKVLVFRDASVEEMLEEARRVGADVVQLDAASAPAAVARRINSEGLSVLRVYDVAESAEDLPRFVSPATERNPALLDVGGGGSGRMFDWSLLGEAAPRFTFVAGGIRPENVEELLGRHPHGIDLSSGVESAPGVKDEGKLRELFERVAGFGSET